jgi:hypothetical protein
MRAYLDATLKNTPAELLGSLPAIDNLPFSFFFRKRKNLGNSPGMGLAIAGDGRLFLADYILHFQECVDLDSEYRKSVPIFLDDNDKWDSFVFYL